MNENNEKLLDDYLTDNLSRPNAEELAQLLHENRNARINFVRHVNEASLFISVGNQIKIQRSLSVSLPAGTSSDQRKIFSNVKPSRQTGNIPLAGAKNRSNTGIWFGLVAASFAVFIAGLWFWNEKDKSGATPVAIASLLEKQGNVTLERNGNLYNINKGAPFYAGDGLRTENGSRAVVSYPDSTRLKLAANTTITLQPIIRGQGAEVGNRSPDTQPSALQSTAYNLNSSKIVQIAGGILSADVAKQPEGLPMVFQTHNARATVLGTRLEISVLDGSTRLRVEEGRVSLQRTDGTSIEVGAGHEEMVVSAAKCASDTVEIPGYPTWRGLKPAAVSSPENAAKTTEVKASAEGENLIEDPSFEEHKANFNFVNGPHWDDAKENAHSGTTSVIVLGGDKQYLAKALPAVGEKKYSLVVHYRAVRDGLKGRMQINWSKQDNSLIKWDMINPSLLTKYDKYEMVVTAPPDAVGALLILGSGSGIDDNIWMDDLFFGVVK